MISMMSFADLISITNAIFGVLAILILSINFIEDINLKIHISLSFIFLGLLADGLDGIVARRFGKSDIGVYLEAMADMSTMVIAPAVLIFFIYSNTITETIRLLYLFVAVGLFLFFGIVRLASFNIMKEKKYYIGLPASASSIILLIFAYFQLDFIFILPSVIIIGAFMASDILFLKTGKILNSIALILIFLTIFFGRSFYGFAPYMLLAAILLYSVAGPIFLFKKGVKLKHKHF